MWPEVANCREGGVIVPGMAHLRGLAPYADAERDQLIGRDRDRDEIVKLITADGARAGLVFGEPGVGKTSLLHAGVLPALRERGAIVLVCHDPSSPDRAFAEALAQLVGTAPNPGEHPLGFVGRIVQAAPANRQFIFVLDDADLALAAGGEQVAAELADLFSRVVIRSGSRARVLLVAASSRVHALGQLEKRTGSLFPPSSRHEVGRLGPADAAIVLERALGLGGGLADRELIDTVVGGLGRGDAVLPADLQLAAVAMSELRITSTAALVKAGGPTELEGAWLAAAARATGHERNALRVVGELAAADGGLRTASQLAQRLGLEAAVVTQALVVLDQRGVVVQRSDGSGWELRHELLAARLRELTAPVRAAARRSYELLGSKAASRQRLTLRELRALRAEGVGPVNDAERAVIARSQRFYLAIAGAIAAVPIVILIALWSANRGRYYYDLERGPGGDRIVVRAGRAGLSSFHWLPSSPGFGEVVADTGLTRAMVDPAAWRKIAAHDAGGDLGGWAAALDRVLEPRLAALWSYAASGDEAALAALEKLSRDPEDLAELLSSLRPIARGAAKEVELVGQALAVPSPAVQQAAVAVAGDAARRGAAAYGDILVSALISADPELRRIALTAVRGLGDARMRELIGAALAKDPGPGPRRELLLAISSAASDDTPSADTAVSVLKDASATPVLRTRAREQLRRAFALDRAAALAATIPLLADEAAPGEARVLAAELLREAVEIKRDDLGGVADAARAAFGAKTDAVRAAALPLYTATDPSRAADDLAALMAGKPGRAMRISIATAWGELARTKPEAAAALDKLIKDSDADVRAAAAAAYGYLGRPAQDVLHKMVKNERFDVAVGAAYGLAASVEAGASVGVAMDGIFQLWKQKGKPRREAARVFAKMARYKAGAVIDYLTSASRMQDDPGLHPIGVEGLCNAANAGSAEARRNLARVTDNPSTDVRRMVIRCVADGPDPAKNGTAIATKLVRDSDPGIRADAARVLALATRAGKVSGSLADALVAMLDDPDRDVRLIAIHAVAGLGAAAPKATAAALTRAFERGDEGERLALLRASRDIGTGDLVQVAITDGAPAVRVEAVDVAIATATRVGATIATALADADPQVRRAALGRIATDRDKLDAAAVERALALAIRDPDPELALLALTTLARVAEKDAVVVRLGRSLASRIEAERSKAAAAAIGLVERDAPEAAKLLAPLLADPSHDVRVAMLPSLGAAWAATNSPEQLTALLRGSEGDAMKRLVATTAFVVLARTEKGRDAAITALESVTKKGPPMARRAATLGLGLINASADGIGFLQTIVP